MTRIRIAAAIAALTLAAACTPTPTSPGMTPAGLEATATPGMPDDPNATRTRPPVDPSNPPTPGDELGVPGRTRTAPDPSSPGMPTPPEGC